MHKHSPVCYQNMKRARAKSQAGIPPDITISCISTPGAGIFAVNALVVQANVTSLCIIISVGVLCISSCQTEILIKPIVDTCGPDVKVILIGTYACNSFETIRGKMTIT